MLMKIIKQIIKKILVPIFGLAPIDANLIVFDNFNGRGFGCNPKYIALKLINSDLDLVWLVNDTSEIFPDGIRAVRYDSIRAWWLLSRSSIRVTNVRNSKGVTKRKDQLLIQTWHASLGPKMIEMDAMDSLSDRYLLDAKQNGLETDLMFSNNGFMTNIYQNSFWYNGPVIRSGVPRNKPLLNPSNNYNLLIKSHYGIPQSNSICLYAPTWRKNDSFHIDSFPYHLWLKALEDRFSNKFTMLLRLHPNSVLKGNDFGKDIVDVSSYPDFQELLAASDVLISDYSSALEDWVLTGRPGFMFTPDFDEYLSDRHFYYPLTDRPYPLAYSSSELCSLIRSYDSDVQRTSIQLFKQRFDFSDDGMGDEAIAGVIINFLNTRSLDLDISE